MSSQEPPKKKSKQVKNKQGTLLSWVKACTSDTEPGVVEETIRMKEQPGNFYSGKAVTRHASNQCR